MGSLVGIGTLLGTILGTVLGNPLGTILNYKKDPYVHYRSSDSDSQLEHQLPHSLHCCFVEPEGSVWFLELLPSTLWGDAGYHLWLYGQYVGHKP